MTNRERVKIVILAALALFCAIVSITFSIDAFLNNENALGWANLSAGMGWCVAFLLHLLRLDA